MSAIYKPFLNCIKIDCSLTRSIKEDMHVISDFWDDMINLQKEQYYYRGE